MSRICLMRMRQAILRFKFLEKHSRVLVGVSGGVDSMVLLDLLILYNRQFQQNWQIHACHINPRFPGWNTKEIIKVFKKFDITYTIRAINIHKKIKSRTKKCYHCARERRKKLLEVADKLGISQIALAHHKQDVAETVLLNMMYNGEISTLVPKQSVIQGRFHFIRPIYYLDKKSIETIARTHGLSIEDNVCPHFQNSKRETVRNFLQRINETNPDVYKNIFRGLFHVKKAYLP